VASGLDAVPSDADGEMTIEELEAAYLRALETSDAAEAAIDVPLNEVSPEAEDVPSRADESRTTEASPQIEIAPASSQITQQSVLEALLFVGGASLTTRKLADVLGLRDPDAVEPLIRELALKYEHECRPYTIGFHQGGYRLELLAEYEPVRRKVHGLSPKEVRLSQEALEILALVAYRQPLSDKDARLAERKNAPAMLRQLLRRELVSLQREDGDAKRVTYSTTPRFLQLFGIGSVEDLPYPEDLEFK
jgi:segregation and condensation protein B